MNSAVDEIDKINEGDIIDIGAIRLGIQYINDIMIISIENAFDQEKINEVKIKVREECNTIEAKENLFIQLMSM